MSVWEINLQSSLDRNCTLICLLPHLPPPTLHSLYHLNSSCLLLFPAFPMFHHPLLFCSPYFLLWYLQYLYPPFFLSSSLSEKRVALSLSVEAIIPLPGHLSSICIPPPVCLAHSSTHWHRHACRQLNRAATHSYQVCHSSVNCHIVISRIVMVSFRSLPSLAFDATLCGTAHLIYQKKRRHVERASQLFITGISEHL